MRILLAMALLCSPVLASAQIYKCTSQDGKVAFTDSPCAPAQQAQTIEHDAVTTARQAEAEKRKALRTSVDGYLQERKEKYRQRRYSSGLRLGMTKDEVKRHPVWGYPDDSNAMTTPYGVRDQWIYEVDEENEFERTYVYFDDDVLVVIQD